jgi:hypothetical protein
MTFQSLRAEGRLSSDSSVPGWGQARASRGASVGGRAPKKLIIVDWDDTVLPTTFLTQLGIGHNAKAHQVPPAVRNALRKYAYRVKETFKLFEEHGKVVIVTNARLGWIEMSCSTFLPEIEALVRSFPRISAQPAVFTEDEEIIPAKWKEEAFVTLAQKHFGDPAGQCVFSLGDAAYEREALRRTADLLGVVAQSVKLLDHPSLDGLDAEHASLQDDGHLQALLSRADGFDLYYDVLDGPKPFLEYAEGRRSSKACEELLQTEQKVPDLGAPPPSDVDDDTPKSQKSTASTCSTASTSSIPPGILAPNIQVFAPKAGSEGTPVGQPVAPRARDLPAEFSIRGFGLMKVSDFGTP